MVKWYPPFPVLGGIPIGGVLAGGIAVLYALGFGWGWWGRRRGDAWAFGVYGGLGVLWQGLWAVAVGEGLPGRLRFNAWNGAGLVLALLPLAAWAFLRAALERPLSWRMAGGMVGAGLVGLLATVLPYRPETGVWVSAAWRAARLPADPILASWAVREFLWGFGTLLALRELVAAYVRIRRPLHRNRLLYMLLGALLVVAGEALAWTPRGGGIMAGWALRALGVFLQVLPLRHMELPVLRPIARGVLAAVGEGILLLALTGLAMAGFLAWRREWPPTTARLADGLLLALLVAAVVRGIGLPLQRRLRRWLLPSVEDPAAVVRHYAQAISNLLDAQALAQRAFAVLGEAFGIRQGALLLFREQPDGAMEAEVIPGLGIGPCLPIRFAADSPILRAWQEGRVLTQYQIDFGDPFQRADPEERGGLQSLGAEWFVPIRAQAALWGCLALGARGGMDVYSAAEMDLLASVAEQTAAVLQNIRLVEDLRRLNARMAELNEDLSCTARRLEKLDRVKTHFIEIASHELRTPLTHIRGYVDLLAETLQEMAGEDGTLQRIVDGLRRSAVRLEEIVNAMLDISQIDAEALSIYPISIPVPTLIRMALEPLEEAFAQRRQTLVVEAAEDLPVIYGDLPRLVQALRHVLQNAIKFTPDGGTIMVRARRVPPEETGGTARYVEIAVQDTGIGIDPEDQTLIFEKFYRVGPIERHSTGSVKFKGAGPGLGLPIARGIVEAHGGRIWVESPGYDEERCPGSTFYIWLPVALHPEDGEAL